MATMYAEGGWRRFTVRDLDRMVEAGILDPEEHVELLDGEILTVGKQGPAQTYARARVAEYWMLDGPARTLTVHRDADGERYGSVTVMDASGVVEPPGSNATLAVRDMLP